MKKKAVVDKKLCVACGCCLTACKLGAISIPHGVCAMIDEDKCVGCGRCLESCPVNMNIVKVIKAVNEKLIYYKQIKNYTVSDEEMEKTTTGKIKRYK